MLERFRRTRSPESQTPSNLQAPGLAAELRSTLDPREILYNFVTAPVCTIKDMARDLPTMAAILAGSWGVGRGIAYLHEVQKVQNPDSIRAWELLAFTAATLAIAGAAHYINRRLPPPFRH